MTSMDATYGVDTHGRAIARRRGRIRRMTSTRPTQPSEGQRIRLLGVDAELADRLGATRRGQRPTPDEPDEGRRGDVRRIDLEQLPQVLAGVAPAEAVRAERDVMRRQPARD